MRSRSGRIASTKSSGKAKRARLRASAAANSTRSRSVGHPSSRFHPATTDRSTVMVRSRSTARFRPATVERYAYAGRIPFSISERLLSGTFTSGATSINGRPPLARAISQVCVKTTSPATSARTGSRPSGSPASRASSACCRLSGNRGRSRSARCKNVTPASSVRSPWRHSASRSSTDRSSCGKREPHHSLWTRRRGERPANRSLRV